MLCDRPEEILETIFRMERKIRRIENDENSHAHGNIAPAGTHAKDEQPERNCSRHGPRAHVQLCGKGDT